MSPDAARPGRGRVAVARSRAALAALAASVLAGSVFAVPPRAWGAEFTPKDGQVLGRTMGYVGDGMTGTAVVGVVYVPGHPASQREADLVRAVIGEGLAAGRVKLQARLVPVDQLPTVSGVDALYITSGSIGLPPVLQAAQRLRVPTVSTDMACVEAAQCAVGFSSQPTVQIVISRGAADRAGVRFVQAFRMLVTER